MDRGIDFVGQVVKPHTRTTRRRTIRSGVQRLRWMPSDDVFKAGNSYLGLARQASHGHHEQALIARVLLKRGHVIAGDISKAFDKAAARRS